MNISAALEKIFAGRWVAGYYPEDALQRTKLFNSKGMSTLINFLGENAKSSQINESVSIYMEIIGEIKKRRLDASISLKPTQIGLYLSYKRMLSNYIKITKFAKQSNVFVWLDMEEPKYVDDTIRAYKRTMHHGNTGICIQADLKRSMSDVETLIRHRAKIRLVKGAYQIKDDTAFSSRRSINHNYMQIMELLFQKSNDFMIATHDSRIIEEAERLNKKYKKRVQFAMLNGIRNKYAKYLAHHCQKVAVYVPFGRDWIAFGYRRLVEQRHITLILRSLFETQSI